MRVKSEIISRNENFDSERYIYLFILNSDSVSWIYILLNILHKNFKKHKVVRLGGQTDKSFYHSTKNEATGKMSR